MKRPAIIWLLPFVLLSLPLAGLQQDSAPSQIQPLLEEVLAINDIVAQGARSRDRCSYPAFFIKMRGPSKGKSRMLVLRSNERCQLVVAARWEGPAFSLDLPAGSVEEVQRPRPGDPGASPAGDDPGVAPLVMEPEPFPELTISQQVWMYGYGGQWDRLTQKNGRLRFAWDNTKAWALAMGGSCSAPGYWNGWQIDGCWLRDANASGEWVWHSGEGQYHWDPWYAPSSYYHSLFDDEGGSLMTRWGTRTERRFACGGLKEASCTA